MNDDKYLLTQEEMNIISILNMITSSLSFLGSGSVIMCSLCQYKMCVSEVYPLFQLSVADLLASTMFGISTILFMLNTVSFPGSVGFCDYLSAVMTSFFISTFFLTMAYALEAYLRIRLHLGSQSTNTGNSDSRIKRPVSYQFMHLVYVICWVFPLVVGIVLLVFTHFVDRDSIPIQNGSSVDIIFTHCSTCLPIFHYTENSCWSLVHNGISWHIAYKVVFLIPLILVFLVNMSLYVFIGKVYRQVFIRRGLLDVHEHQEEHSLRKKAILYQSVFVITWLPTLVLGIASFVPSFHMTNFFWLYILQAIFGPLQGFLNSVIYGWKRASFRQTLSEITPLTESNSLRSYLSLTL